MSHGSRGPPKSLVESQFNGKPLVTGSFVPAVDYSN